MKMRKIRLRQLRLYLPPNSKMLRLIILALTIAFATAAPSFITSTGVDLQPIFNTFNDNGDSVIEKDELAQLMIMADEDADDLVTAAEFEKYWKDLGKLPADKHAKYFKLVDGLGKADGAEDGTIDLAERNALFNHIDADKSGGVSMQEFFDAISGVIN
jgi:Ca2+-binding EF-hand superfamily protein